MAITYQGVLTFPAERTQELKTDIIEEAQQRASGFTIDQKIPDAIRGGIIYFDEFTGHVRKDFSIIAKAAQEHGIPLEGEVRYNITSENNRTTEGILIVKDGFLEDLQGDDALLHCLSERALIREVKKRTAESTAAIEYLGLSELSGRDAIMSIVNDNDLDGTYYLAKKQTI